MKKILAALVCLSMILCMFGCIDKDAAFIIDLGGGLGKMTLEGDAYGDYEVTDNKDAFIDDGDGTVTVYQDMNCDTPYVVVYRFAKGDYTLDTIAQEEADRFSKGYYQKTKSENNRDMVCLFTYGEIDGKFYYVSSTIVEDGEDFVIVDYYAKTEELAIGDTGVYAWVPVGYTSHMDQDYKDHGTYFVASYSEDYYMPDMFIGKWDSSYEYMEWYCYEDYPNGLPFTAEEYAAILEAFEKGEIDDAAYYQRLGYSIKFDSSTDERYNYQYNASFCSFADLSGAEGWFQIGEQWYLLWFGSELNPSPAYVDAFLFSLHTK